MCPRCEYNLRGLAPGMKCPECGAVIVTAAGASAHDENLAAAPRHYLKVLAVGLALMAVAGVAAAVLFPQRRPPGINWAVVTGAIAALAWWVGACIVTQPKPHAVVRKTSPRMAQRHARWAVRLTQLGWGALPVGLGLAAHLDRQAMAAAAAVGGVYTRPEASELLVLGAWVGAAVAGAGLVILCYMLADLAEWASDSPLADRLRLAGLGVPIGTPLALAGWAFYDKLGPITLIGLAGAVIGTVAMVGAAAVLIVGLVQLGNLAIWAVHNNLNYDQLMLKRDAREQAYDREMIERLDPTPNDPGSDPSALAQVQPVPPAEPAGSAMVIPSTEHVIPRPTEVRPYDLAADDQPR
ncbi:MAG: hypothetical protein AMXMBFR58_09520 [Phycisphaerae bacterium]